MHRIVCFSLFGSPISLWKLNQCFSCQNVTTRIAGIGGMGIKGIHRSMRTNHHNHRQSRQKWIVCTIKLKCLIFTGRISLPHTTQSLSKLSLQIESITVIKPYRTREAQWKSTVQCVGPELSFCAASSRRAVKAPDRPRSLTSYFSIN